MTKKTGNYEWKFSFANEGGTVERRAVTARPVRVTTAARSIQDALEQDDLDTLGVGAEPVEVKVTATLVGPDGKEMGGIRSYISTFQMVPKLVVENQGGPSGGIAVF